MSRKTFIWLLAALLGIAITAGITWATSTLTSQHIGLSSEPLSTGRGLAPPQAESAPEEEEASSTTSTTRSHDHEARGGHEPDD